MCVEERLVIVHVENECVLPKACTRGWMGGGALFGDPFPQFLINVISDTVHKHSAETAKSTPPESWKNWNTSSQFIILSPVRYYYSIPIISLSGLRIYVVQIRDVQ